MKKILLLMLVLLSVGSCSKFDDSKIWDELKSHEKRIVRLETICDQINTNITSLQAIVIALQNNDYITNVAPIISGNEEVGYTITFAKSGSITIYHGQDGENGNSPVIGIKEDTDGKYYWTLDGEWLKDANGNRIPASGENGKDGADGKDGVTPQIKVENDYWYVSYDNGATWKQLYKVAAGGGAGNNTSSNIISNITQDENFAYITLIDGTTIVLPKANTSSVSIQIGDITLNSVTFIGTINKKTVDLKVTIYYGEDDTIDIYNNARKVSMTNFNGKDTFSIVIDGLKSDSKYYYFTEIVSGGVTTYSELDSFDTDNFNESNDEAIVFEDPIVELVCLSKHDINGDGKLSLSEAASVETIDRFFFGEYSEAVKSFDEFKYFTNIKELDYCQFDGCINLKSIILPNNLEKIGYGSFQNCKKLEKIIIPDSVKTIGSYAFVNCHSLVDIVIPDSVIDMYGGFSNCYKLASVVIGDGVKVIYGGTFHKCDAITRIQFGANIESIETNNFNYIKIKDVIVADLDKWLKVKFEDFHSSPTAWGANLWEGDQLVTKCTIPGDIVSFGGALRGCGSLEEVIISDGVISITDEAFWACKNLNKIKIGKDVVSIGREVFYSCDKLSCFEGKFASEDGRCIVMDGELRYHAHAGLTEYTIPKGVKSIGCNAFSSKGPQKVIIGNDVETIEKMAFYNCGIKEVVIEENVKTIKEDAFGWTNMETVYCKSAVPPTAESTDVVGWDAFYNTPLKNIYVPSASVEAYKTADGWKEYANYIKAYDFGN